MRTEDGPTPGDLARAARALVHRYGWQLVTEARLVARVAGRRSDQATPPPTLDILCEQEAGAELFAACERGGLRTATPAERQAAEAAYHDLGNYLTVVARHLPPPAPGVTWDDLVQATLLEIYRKHHTCTQPRAFLGWAVTILKRQGAATWRTAGREVPLPAGEQAEAALLRQGGNARNRHVDPEGDQDLLRVLHECLDTDEERLRALWEFQGWKRREWALVFDAPLTRFDRLGVIIKRKLRQCLAFRALIGPPLAAV